MIIGISGKIGSGKTYTAKYIKNKLLQYNFEKKSFGYNVKKIVSFLTGIPMTTILSRKAKSIYLSEWNMTLGEMFQNIGTEALRDNFHSDVWILSMFAKYNDNKNWIIDDVRFSNEAKKIKELGGILIRLEGDPKGVRKKDIRKKNHKSETMLDDYQDFDILFNSETDDLNNLIYLIMQQISKKI